MPEAAAAETVKLPAARVPEPEEPMSFPADGGDVFDSMAGTGKFPRVEEADLWGGDQVGFRQRRKEILRRAIPLGLAVALGVVAIVGLWVLLRESGIPEVPRTSPPAAQAPVLAPAAVTDVGTPPAPVVTPPSVPAEVVAVAAVAPSPPPAQVPVVVLPPDPVPAAPSPVAQPVQPVPPAPSAAPLPAAAPVPAAMPRVIADDEPPLRGVPAAPPSPSPSPGRKSAGKKPEAQPRAPSPVPPRPAVPPSPVETGAVVSYDSLMKAGQREMSRSPSVAMESFRKASEARPNRVDPVARMAECAVRMGDLESAGRLFRAALKLGPSHAPTLVGMARVQKAQGKVSDARYYYTRYLEVNPQGNQAEEAQSYLERNP